MTLQFKKATKEQARLRLAIFGPSGSGKTYTSLRLAAGLGGQIAFIDTERGSASKYADRFEFDVLELPKKDIATYCQAIGAAQKAGYDVLIIDSLTHAWHELLGEVDKLAASKYRGNTWSAWSEGTPKQRQLVDTILNFDGHVIATMRTKTEWAVQDAGNGKTRPVRVGLAPEQGKGIEYEFDLLMEISPDHIATVIKDRTGKYQDVTFDKPGEELGNELVAWLLEGKKPSKARKPPQAEDDGKGEDAALRERARSLAGETGTNLDPAWLDEATPAELAATIKEMEGKAKSSNGKPVTRAKVGTSNWTAVGERVAADLAYFQDKDGSPDWYHLLGAAAKCDFTDITDSNLEAVEAALRDYAEQQAKQAA